MKKDVDIKIYEGENGQVHVEVKIKDETIWLNQKEISQLFEIDQSVISRHINNIFRSKELDKKSNMQKMHIANSDKGVNFYNLDTILSVGYRVNSKKATAFRVWANNILKKYLINGYAINEKKFLEAQSIIQFITAKARNAEIEGHEKEILDVIERYSKTWKILGEYDEGKIQIEKFKKTKYKLNYDKCRQIIENLKKDLVSKKLIGDLFGQERDSIFESILGNLYQTFAGEQLYGSIEERAAHLLYFVIKDHPFLDGNKRIGSLLFLHFLNQNNFLFKVNNEVKISDKTLVALALLVASSNPKEKDSMVKLVINLIQD